MLVIGVAVAVQRIEWFLRCHSCAHVPPARQQRTFYRFVARALLVHTLVFERLGYIRPGQLDLLQCTVFCASFVVCVYLCAFAKCKV